MFTLVQGKRFIYYLLCDIHKEKYMHDVKLMQVCFFSFFSFFSEKSLQDRGPGLPANYMNGEIV